MNILSKDCCHDGVILSFVRALHLAPPFLVEEDYVPRYNIVQWAGVLKQLVFCHTMLVPVH